MSFQKSFLGTQLVILLADWLQAPYNYKVNITFIWNNFNEFTQFTFCIRIILTQTLALFLVSLHTRTNRNYICGRACILGYFHTFCKLCCRPIWESYRKHSSCSNIKPCNRYSIGNQLRDKSFWAARFENFESNLLTDHDRIQQIIALMEMEASNLAAQNDLPRIRSPLLHLLHRFIFHPL